MKHYNKEEVSSIKKASETLYKAYNDADVWVNKNLKYEEKEHISTKLKHGKRIINKFIKTIESKPVFALFGVSQVGKSYLVKNMLSVKGAPLTIELNNTAYNFLEQINPQGGAESTGVVTRFTIDRSEGSNNTYEVKIRLHSVKDLIIILCDSFFSDLSKMENYPSRESYTEHINFIVSRYTNENTHQNNLTEEDLWDIQDYFDKHFNKFSHFADQIHSSGYWMKIGNVIQKVPLSEWHNVFSILWSRNEHITKLFNVLLDSLQKLSFSDTAYAPYTAVLREGGKILDVITLSKLMSNNDEYIKVLIDSTKEITIPISHLSALSAELTLNLPVHLNQQKPFLNNTDILDFPGARSRQQLIESQIAADLLPAMFLRGKVSYLFNKYSSDFEINNLLFCINDAILEVKEIPSILNTWINNNIGKSSIERTERIAELSVSPLFVIFTFINKQLRFDTTNDPSGLDYKWNNRFIKSFEDEYVTKTNNWHTSWTEAQPTFNNFYLLRDYKYSEDTFIGFEQYNEEKEINPLRKDYIEKLKTSFTNHSFVKKHFHHAAEVINHILTPNQDGSELIIKNLMPAANNTVKINNYLALLQHYKSELTNTLKEYVQSENLAEKRRKALDQGIDLELEFAKIFGRNEEYFGMLTRKINLKDSDIFNHIHQNLLKSQIVKNNNEYELLRISYPELKPENSVEQNLQILVKNNFGNTIEDVKKKLEEKGINIENLFKNEYNSSATLLVDGIINKWKEKLSFENLNFLLKEGVSKSIIESFSNMMIHTIENLNIREKLIELLAKKTEKINLGREEEEYLASACTYILNDFASDFGFNLMSTERIEELKEVSTQYNIDISSLNGNSLLSISDQSIENLFNNNINDITPFQRSFKEYIIKMKLALLSNCGFVKYDVQANANLIELIKQNEEIMFIPSYKAR